MLHPDDASSESWTSRGDVGEMFTRFEGWDPRWVFLYQNGDEGRY